MRTIKFCLMAIFCLIYFKMLAQTANTHNYKTPLFKLSPEQAENKGDYLRYSVLTGYRAGITPKIGSSEDSLSKIHRFYMLNYSKMQLCLNAYSEFFIRPNQVILKVKDPAMYRNNLYCYELITPGSMYHHTVEKKIENWDHWYQLMKDDVPARLGVTCERIDKYPQKCLVLVRTDSKDRMRTKGTESKVLLDGETKHFYNVPIGRLLDKMNAFPENPQVLDETQYKGKVDLELPIHSWTDIEQVRIALHRYGLDLREAVRELKVFVITENKK